LKDTLCNLADIVKEKIAVEMKEAKRGAIMYDGRTLSGVHYIGLFACYIIQKKL